MFYAKLYENGAIDFIDIFIYMSKTSFNIYLGAYVAVPFKLSDAG